MVQKSVLSLAALLTVCGAALAQGGPPGGGPPGGGFGGGGGGFMASLPPAAQAKMKAWRTFNDNHKNYRGLTGTFRAIGEMDKEPATALTKDQAKKIKGIIAPWQSKPVMTDDQALKVTKDITGVLTTAQLKKYASLQAQQGRGGFGGGGGRMGGPGGGGPPGGGFGGPGGGGPPGGGGGFGGGAPGGGRGGFGGPPGGGGGPGGGRGGFDFSKMADPKEYNPLNPASFPQSPFSARQKQRLEEFTTLIKTKSA